MEFEVYPSYLSADQFAYYWQDYFLEHPPTENTRVNLYIHYPWCRNICKFCVFGKYRYDQEDKYRIYAYEDLLVDLTWKVSSALVRSDIIPGEVYFGGGTASLNSLDTLKQIRNHVRFFDMIPIRTVEMHPLDLDQEHLDVYALDTNHPFNRISIGVQTFNPEVLHHQNRDQVTPKFLRSAVEKLQKANVFVNIDLIAMLDGDDKSQLNTFLQDLDIAVREIEPDSISISPNYKSHNYYEISKTFRSVLKTYLDQFHFYQISDPYALSLNEEDIIRYADEPYVLVKRNGLDYQTMHVSRSNQEQIMIGIGGYGASTAYSKTPEGMHFSCQFLPQDREFIFTANHDTTFGINENDLYNSRVRVGSHTIDPPKHHEKEDRT